MPRYHLYSADISPFGQRVEMLMKFKRLDYTRESPPGGFQSDEYGLITPIRKLPVLKVDDAWTLPESEVICEYLEEVEPDPSALPKGAAARANGRLMARIADTYIMNPMMPLFSNFSRKTRDQAVVDLALANIRRGLEFLDHWIAPDTHANDSELTMADFAIAPILRYVQQYPPVFGMDDPMSGLKNVRAYHDSCRKEPLIDEGLSKIEQGWEAMRSGKH